MQGRLLPKVNQRIQAFPGEDWWKELEKANFIGIKNLEWTFDHDKLFENPILDFKMINNYAFGYVYDYKNDKWIQSDIHPDTEKYVRVYKILQRVNSTVIDLLKWRNSIDNYQILTKNSIFVFTSH